MKTNNIMKINKKLLFIVCLLIVDIISWAYIILGDSSAVNRYFVANANFSDFFSPLQKLRVNAYGEPYFSNYPPLANAIFLLIKKAGNATEYPQFFGDTALGIIFVVFVSGSILAIYEIGKKYLKNDGMIINVLCLLAIMVSGPFLFLYSRANNLLCVIPLVMFFVKYYNSDKKYLRELACILLAIATALKIYPVFFGLLLIKKGNGKICVRTCIYGIISFFGPFLVFGPNSVNMFINNLLRREGNYTVNHLIGVKGSIQIIAGMFLKRIVWNKLTICWVIALLAMVYVFLVSKEEWKKVFALSMISIWIFKGSYLYNICLLVIPLLMFLDTQKNRIIDYVYTVLFGILFAIMFLPDADKLNVLLAENNLGYVSWAIIVIDFILIVTVGIVFLDTLWRRIMNRKI